MLRRKRDQISWSNEDSCSNLSIETGGGGRGGAEDTMGNPQSPPLWNNNPPVAAAAVPFSSSMAVDSNASTAGATNSACDNHSTYSSQRSSSLVLDASSMSAACSARPRKRQRTTLTDALQCIRLDRQIPEQIVPQPPNGARRTSLTAGDGFAFVDPNRQMLQGMLASEDDISGEGMAGLSDDGDHQVGDCLIDDNSQLTASDVEDNVEVEEEGDRVSNFGNVRDVVVSTEDMEDGSSQLDDESLSMTDVEKARRQAVLDFVLGKKNGIKTNPLIANSLSNAKMDVFSHDPVDRKIEDLYRQSWKNVQKGLHPLLVKTGNTDADDESSGRLTTQDDMMIDPKIYHNPASCTSMMITDGTESSANEQPAVGFPVPVPEPPKRERSNSLPDSMEFDGDYTYPTSWQENKATKTSAPAIPLPLPMEQNNNSSYASQSMSLSDIDLD
jgi:hypothetical protein